MNGFFTIEESKHLTLEELQHYIGVGLVAGLETEMVSNFLYRELDNVHSSLKRVEHDYQEAKGEQVDLENKLELQHIQIKELIGDLQDTRKEYNELKHYFDVWSGG